MKRGDRELGMDRAITRRDFIGGVGVAITGSALPRDATMFRDREGGLVIRPMGVPRDALRKAFDDADRVYFLASSELDWNPESALAALGAKLTVARDVPELLEQLLSDVENGDQVIFMSNGGFGGLPHKVQQALKSREPKRAESSNVS